MKTRISIERLMRKSIAGLAATMLLAVGLTVGVDVHATPGEKAAEGDPYPLDTCIVMGGKLGSMGDPVVYDHEGREVRFCCKGCIGSFEKDPGKFVRPADEKIIEKQLESYPLDHCLVDTDESLVGPEAKPVDLVYKNRLVRFCCKGCVRKFTKDPQGYLEKLDEAVLEQQKDDYALETCVVGGGKLGSMGEPIDHVMNNRLFRLCCKGCIKSLHKEPVKYHSMLDAAEEKKQ